MMPRTYDNWERLVDAVQKREELRYTALYCDSFSSTSTTSTTFAVDLDAKLSLTTEQGLIHRAKSDPIGSPISIASESEIPVRPVPRHIAYKEVEAATKSFRPGWIIGSASFGNVYKGWIDLHNLTAAKPGNGTPVAVKKLNSHSFRAEMSVKGRDEWSTEIGYLRHLNHPNVVNLIGYCSEKDILLVVYEFMPKGSLDYHLFKSNLTARCDVYSFGVVLLELLCGRRVIEKQKPPLEQDLVEWTRPFLSDKNEMLKIMDPKLKARYPKEDAHSIAVLVYRCLSLDAEERPRMSEVLVELERL